MKFIGICGKKGSGKSIVDQMILEYFINVKTLSFSEPIKQMTKSGYLLSDEQLDLRKDIIDERWDMTPRDMMRSTAQMMTFLDENHMCDLMTLRIGQVSTSGLTHICISDIRFHNESDLVKQLGGIMIHIKNVSSVEEENEHISECYVDEIDHYCDYHVVNDGNMESMRSQVDSICRQINK